MLKKIFVNDNDFSTFSHESIYTPFLNNNANISRSFLQNSINKEILINDVLVIQQSFLIFFTLKNKNKKFSLCMFKTTFTVFIYLLILYSNLIIFYKIYIFTPFNWIIFTFSTFFIIIEFLKMFTLCICKDYVWDYPQENRRNYSKVSSYQ